MTFASIYSLVNHYITRYVLSIVIFIGIFIVIDLSQGLSALGNLDILAVSTIFLLFIGAITLSSVRFWHLNQMFGTSLGKMVSHKINIYGLLYGLIAIPTIAQAVGRVTHSQHYSRNPEIQIGLTIFEKITSAMMLFCIVIFGLILTGEGISYDKDVLEYITIFFVGLVFVGLLIFKFGLENRHRVAISDTIREIRKLKFFVTLLLSLSIHIVSLLAYFLAARSFFPDISAVNSLVACAIIMLVTSIPISFSGWGIREISAVFAFSSLGGSAEVAAIMGIVIGTLYLCALAVQFLCVRFSPSHFFKAQLPSAFSTNVNINFSIIPLLTFIMFFIGLFIPAQFRIPSETGFLTINIADPLVFISGFSFLAFIFFQRRSETLWHDSLFKIGLIIFGGIICLSWLNGFIRFGSNDWATVNRGLGFIILLAYLMTGAAISHFLIKADKTICVLLILLSSLTFSILQIFLEPFVNQTTIDHFNWSHFSGFFLDRNAYSLLLCMLICFLIPIFRNSQTKSYYPHIIFSTVLWLLTIAGSRSALGACVILLIILAIYSRKSLLKIVIFTAIIILAYQLLYILVEFYSNIIIRDYNIFSRDLIDIKQGRITIILSSFKLWMNHPFFGAGLGAYIQNHTAVIHNLPLWLLAETGIIGFLLFCVLPFSIARHIFSYGFKNMDDDKLILLSLILVISVFSMTQDIIYQRAVWLLLGLLMARPAITNIKIT